MASTWFYRIRGGLKFVRAHGVLLAAVVIISGGTLAFVDIAGDMREGSGLPFDTYILHTLHPGPDPSDPVGPAWLYRAMADLTSMGSLAVLTLIAIIAVGYLVLCRRMLQAIALIVGLGGGLALSESLKQLFMRTRPPEIYRASESLNASFPSGHTLMATVFYLTIGVMLAGALKHRFLRVYVLLVGMLLAVIVGITRVYLGVHWASDVLAGWSVGAAWATLCWLVERTIQNSLKPLASADSD